jgi:hypothetical protein
MLTSMDQWGNRRLAQSGALRCRDIRTQRSARGRDSGYPLPPAQTRAGAANAHAGGADIDLYVCAPVIASLSRARGVHENRINQMSSAVGAQGGTLQWCRRHTRQCLRHPRAACGLGLALAPMWPSHRSDRVGTRNQLFSELNVLPTDTPACPPGLVLNTRKRVRHSQ